ncbi:MAG: mismatch-specific DNA-glycosylase [Actinomycetota bacterium]
MTGTADTHRFAGPMVDVPRWLADLHRRTPADGAVGLRISGENDPTAPSPLDLIEGGGFALEPPSAEWPPIDDGLTVRRLRTLPDRVGPGMRALVVGLNPSPASADGGVAFARPGNRFWPAMLAAGLATVDRDPVHALDHHGVGFTDLVKRTTRQAAELDALDYRNGLARLDRLCAWLRPERVIMVGLTGWRAAVDRKATAGWQEPDLGGSPVYLMPNTSGLNAHTTLDGFIEHLRAAQGSPPPAP